jgi:CheY-like chemotaxis protein
MKKKLNCILLIDDDKDCNFYHKKLLAALDCAEAIEVATDGLKALDFLHSSARENKPAPDIIFLDINMPRMNGWEFLQEYEKFPLTLRATILLIMLSTSLNPDDRARALASPVVNGFKEKYLTEEIVTDILRENFS